MPSAPASDCWASGPYGVPNQTLIEHWNGTSWSIVASANFNPLPKNFPQAVTCASTSDCWMVGYYTASAYQTLIEHWDGTAWSIVASPNTSATKYNQLYGVTCTSASDCWAVGDYYNAS